jgi:hypothetical protein
MRLPVMRGWRRIVTMSIEEEHPGRCPDAGDAQSVPL